MPSIMISHKGHNVIFANYLKDCRNRYNLTQEELAQEFFNFDDIFHGIDAVTISRWERGVTAPSMERLKLIIKVFQKFSHKVFSCFDVLDKKEIESIVCNVGIKNVSKKVKQHIVEFPKDILDTSKVKITDLKECKDENTYIRIAHKLDKSLTQNYSHINYKNFKEWTQHASSFFAISMYQEQFFGMVFFIKLKIETFERIMNFEMDEYGIRADDFADVDEDGSIYVINLFAISQYSATQLIMSFYMYLIKHQDSIKDIGRITKTKEGAILSQNIGLELHKEKQSSEHLLRGYRATLSNVLINEALLKVLFKKSE